MAITIKNDLDFYEAVTFENNQIGFNGEATLQLVTTGESYLMPNLFIELHNWLAANTASGQEPVYEYADNEITTTFVNLAENSENNVTTEVYGIDEPETDCSFNPDNVFSIGEPSSMMPTGRCCLFGCGVFRQYDNHLPRHYSKNHEPEYTKLKQKCNGRFHCLTCGKGIQSIKGLTRHINSAHPDKNYLDYL